MPTSAAASRPRALAQGQARAAGPAIARPALPRPAGPRCTACVDSSAPRTGVGQHSSSTRGSAATDCDREAQAREAQTGGVKPPRGAPRVHPWTCLTPALGLDSLPCHGRCPATVAALLGKYSSVLDTSLCCSLRSALLRSAMLRVTKHAATAVTLLWLNLLLRVDLATSHITEASSVVYERYKEASRLLRHAGSDSDVQQAEFLLLQNVADLGHVERHAPSHGGSLVRPPRMLHHATRSSSNVVLPLCGASARAAGEHGGGCQRPVSQS